MKLHLALFRLALPLLLCTLLTACGSSSRPGTADVSGTVTYQRRDGKSVPVTGGDLGFYKDGVQVYACAIGPTGSFSATQVPLGEMKVTVSTDRLRTTPPSPEDTNPPRYVAIPRKYASPRTTPLSWAINPGQEEKDLVLTD